MRAARVSADRLLVPMTAQADDGTRGEGLVEIDSTHPQFSAWDAYLRRGQAADRS